MQEDLEKTDGVYCLRTNRQGANEQELWDYYNTIRDKGIHDSWSKIREILSMHTRNSITQKREDGKVIHIRKSSRPEPHQKVIYDALNIASAPGRMVKKSYDH